MESVMTSVDNQPKVKELPKFVHFQGPSPRTKLAKTSLKIFQLFFTTAIFSCIVEQTKLFALQKGKTLELCNQKIEIMAFIGINITMGMLRLPQVKDYWSTNKILATLWFPESWLETILHSTKIFTFSRF